MLRFERRVVAAMTGATDLRQRAEVEDFVGGTLAAMPEHLRAGVALASVGLGGVAFLAGGCSRAAADHHDPVVSRLMALRVGPVQQYFRLFRSLVVFAEHETALESSI